MQWTLGRHGGLWALERGVTAHRMKNVMSRSRGHCRHRSVIAAGDKWGRVKVASARYRQGLIKVTPDSRYTAC